jgi:hypothetical protein
MADNFFIGNRARYGGAIYFIAMDNKTGAEKL